MRVDPAEVGLYRSAFSRLFDEDIPPERFLARLDELGWAELADECPADAVGLLFEQQGRQLAATRALDLVVARAAGVALDGRAIVHSVSAGPSGTLLDDGDLVVEGVVLTGAREATTALVLAEDGLVAVPFAALDVAPVGGFDPSLALCAVRGQSRGQVEAEEGADALGAVARRALAHELVGAADAMLELTLRQVAERHQFGRPIAAFQTVKHRLADVKVALEAARGGLAAAWRTEAPLPCLVAKALAGRAAVLAVKHCQQLCGAIGFTVEHPLPAFIRRTRVLDVLHGSTANLQECAGRRLIADRAAPRLPPPW